MAKIRKNIKNINDIPLKNEQLYASYYYKKVRYVSSDDKVYDDFEKEVYELIGMEANNGYYILKLALKIYPEKTFEWNSRYDDIFQKLKINLLMRGFEVQKSGNYFLIMWNKPSDMDL